MEAVMSIFLIFE